MVVVTSRRFAWAKKPDKMVEQNESQKQICVLIAEMEKLMALDQILEARKIVNEIHKQKDVVLTKSQQVVVEEIVSQSDHVLSLIHEMQSDDGWTLSRCKHGVTVHYRHEPPSPIHAVKTRFLFEDMAPTDFVKLCAIFNESDLMDQWFPQGILTSIDVLAAPSTYHQIMHLKFSLGRFVPIAPRDAILDGRGYHLPDINAILVFSQSINSSPYCDVPPPQKGFVRMETKTAFFMQLLPGNKMVLVQISHDDLKVKLMPAWLVNFIAEGTVPFYAIQGLRKALANFEGSDFEKRVQSNPDVYKEIEDRLLEELASMEKDRKVDEHHPKWPLPPTTKSTVLGEELPFPPSTVIKSKPIVIRADAFAFLAIVVAFVAGFVRGKNLYVSGVVAVVTGLLWLFLLRYLKEQVSRRLREKKEEFPEKKEELITTPIPADVPFSSMPSVPHDSAKKSHRGKSAKRLVKVVSAPMGLIRKWKRRQGKRAKTDMSVASEPRGEINERRKTTEDTVLIYD